MQNNLAVICFPSTNYGFPRLDLFNMLCISCWQSLFLPHPSGKPKHVPAPPPRASSHTVSRESSLKYSQTLQRDSPRGAKRDLSQQYHTQTLPLPSSKPKQRPLTDSPTPLSSNSSTSSGSHASVKYEGMFILIENVQMLWKQSKVSGRSEKLLYSKPTVEIFFLWVLLFQINTK